MKKYLNYNILKTNGANLTTEDAVIIRNDLIKEINNYNIICLDFTGIDNIAPNFYSTLFTNLISRFGMDEIYAKLTFKNIKNKECFIRAYFGTTNVECA